MKLRYFFLFLSISKTLAIGTKLLNGRPNAILKPICSSLAILTTCFGLRDPVFAAIAPLADVGVGKYLVKDGRQLLRLSLPVGKDMLMGTKARNTVGMKAQESLELIRLRLEETGFSNPAAWPEIKLDLEKVSNYIDGKQGEQNFIETSVDPESARKILQSELKPALSDLSLAIKDRNVDSTLTLQEKSASILENLRATELPSLSLPYEIPSEYSNLPR